MFQSHSDEDCTKTPYDWSGGEIPARESAFTSLRRLLQRDLPEPGTLSDPDLIALLNDIEFDLIQCRVRVDFLDTLPARVAYKGILQLLDTPIGISDDFRAIQHLDGCDSACESCFQLAHCAVAREVLGSEWRIAVESAGVNPGWAALFNSSQD
jgi:hypothetical protein